MVTAKPKPMEPLSRWIEDNLRLPAGISAVSGPLKLHPYQREIADAMADPRIERVSVIKSARVGYTTLLVGLIAHHIVRDPAPILVLMPTESDCRGLMSTILKACLPRVPHCGITYLCRTQDAPATAIRWCTAYFPAALSRLLLREALEI